MHDLPVRLQIRHARNLRQRLALGVIDHRVIKFLAANKINLRAIAQRFFRQHGHVRPHKRNLDRRIRLLDGLRQQNVARESRRRSEQHQKFVVLAQS